MKTEIKCVPHYYFKSILLPLVMMLGLVGISGALFDAAAQFFLKSAPTTDAVLANVFFSYAYAMALAFFLGRKPLRAWFSRLLALFMLGQLLFSCAVTWEAAQEMIAPYLALLLKSSFLPIVVWGFANRITHVSEGMRYYIPLAFFSTLVVVPFSHLLSVGSADQARLFLVGSSACIALTWIIFRWLSQKLPEERWLDEKRDIEPTKISYVFRFGFAFGAFAVVFKLLDPFLRTALKTASTSWTGAASAIIGVGVLLLCSFCLFLGPWLLKRTGWLLSAMTPSLIITQVIALFHIFSLSGFLVPEMAAFTTVILRALPTALLMPLLQIGYLSLPKPDRFRTKAWAEMVFAPMVVATGPFLLQFLLSQFGTLSVVQAYAIPLAMGITIALATLLTPIGKRKALLLQPKQV